ncbi:hypothetical protein [Rhizobium leguminosarum]|uniref:hypothetical protein n=1 Tax=Rhizobium leguminosarum TaxID=384 RepID=UPI00144101C9|nr:hypothetical protein [Rhizobium leguminosarum]NKL64871.1 hypothetical protein [Rhizobium leguminosarum bv. viciae]
MAGIVRLDDNNTVHASNLGLAGALEQIGLAISDVDPRLARWLIDKSNRTGIFMDFYLRDLSDDLRAAFWLGVDRANEKFRDIGPDVWSFGPRDPIVPRNARYSRRGWRQAGFPNRFQIWFDDDTNTA